MSLYIPEKALQDFIIDNITALDLNIKYRTTYHKLIEARLNGSGGFWDLEGKLENGLWIPIEVEWKSDNFLSHKHYVAPSFNAFIEKKGILLVLRKSREIPNIHQYGILDTIPESKFKALFVPWYRVKYKEYVDKTLDNYFVGKYTRSLHRILVIPVSSNARKNYFSMEPLYRKKPIDPLALGFKENGYKNNEFVKDIQPGDICLFIESDGNRTPRKTFIEKIRKQQLPIKKLVAFQIESKLYDVRKEGNRLNKLDKLYWPDEIKKGDLIYPYRCKLASKPFLKVENSLMPFIKDFSEEKWESFRSCIQYGSYFEMTSNDFVSLISNLKQT